MIKGGMPPRTKAVVQKCSIPSSPNFFAIFWTVWSVTTFALTWRNAMQFTAHTVETALKVRNHCRSRLRLVHHETASWAGRAAISLPNIDGSAFDTRTLAGRAYMLSFLSLCRCPFCTCECTDSSARMLNSVAIWNLWPSLILRSRIWSGTLQT